LEGSYVHHYTTSAAMEGCTWELRFNVEGWVDTKIAACIILKKI
jgi:hypothetical protein